MCRYAQSNGNDKQTTTGMPEDVSLPQNKPKLQDLPIGTLDWYTGDAIDKAGACWRVLWMCTNVQGIGPSPNQLQTLDNW